MTKSTDPESNVSTEEKIKRAATEVFAQKGFAATRTRDIAEAAGINLALLNYYFRSKQKLFDGIMLEKLQELFGRITPIFTDTTTSLEKKIETLVDYYIETLIKNPELPLFVLSEIRTHPQSLSHTIQIAELFTTSSFAEQLKAKRPDTNPLHFIMCLLGMTVFPFVAKPLLKSKTAIDEASFVAMMTERKRLIPLWMNTILETPTKV